MQVASFFKHADLIDWWLDGLLEKFDLVFSSLLFSSLDFWLETGFGGRASILARLHRHLQFAKEIGSHWASIVVHAAGAPWQAL